MKNPAVGRVSAEFGTLVEFVTSEPRTHRGIDIANVVGTDVTAAMTGRVAQVGSDLVEEGDGLGVVVESGGSAQYYCHLSETMVSEGDTVRAGEVIAAIGSTGNVTGPHLHFETWDRAGDPSSAYDPAN